MSQRTDSKVFSQCLFYHLSQTHLDVVGGSLRKMASECVVDSKTLTKLDMQLRHMVDNVEFGNVTFVCEDEIRVHADRQLLAERSPYFKQLLVGEMIESTISTVELPTVPSSVLILVMKFLYTEKLIPADLCSSASRVLPSAPGNDCFRPDWNLVVNAVAVARFYMLDHLEKVLIEQLEGDVSRGVFLGEENYLTQLVKRFSILHEYPTLWAVETEGNPIDTLSRLIAAALRNNDLSPATLSILSEAAFCCYMEKEMEASGDVESSEIRASLLDDYLRLREILTWCTVSDGCGVFENLDRTCLPGAEMAIDFIDPVEDESSRPELDFSRGRASFTSRIAKGSLKPLLKYVDFTCIPTGLLRSVIEPLEIIEPVELAKALRTQAMRTSGRMRGALDAPVRNLWHVMGESVQYMWRLPVETDNILRFTVRKEIDYLDVCAVAGLLMDTSMPHEWSITVTSRGLLERETMGYFEFGFIALDFEDKFDELRGPLSADSRYSAIRVGWDNRTVVAFYNGRETGRFILGVDDQFGWSESVVMSIRADLSKTSKNISYLARSSPMSKKISYLAGSRKFSFVAAEQKRIYPAIYFPLGASGQQL